MRLPSKFLLFTLFFAALLFTGCKVSPRSETAAPNAPTNFSNGSIGNYSISFSWTDASSDEDNFEVESCDGSNCTDFTAVSASPLLANDNSHTEEDLTLGTVYRFRVRAVKDSAQSSWLTSGNITARATAASCASPKTRVVDRGLKGNVTGVGRGLWSDTKIIPGTQLPATAYYDGSATGGTASIKISYWDGSKFNVEHVAADRNVAAGSATWVKLAFLTVGANAGRPIIVWTTGATLVKAAMRSAAFPGAGVWEASVIDTVAGAASRAASISVSPADDVGVAYLTNSTAEGRARFIYCTACTALSGFVTMTAAGDNLENTTQATTLMGISTAWCNNAGTYVPAVAYHGNTAANLRYSVCTGAITTCKTSAGWAATNIVAAAAPVSVDMLIGSTSQDTVKILAKNAAGTAMNGYISTAGCHAPTSFAVGPAIGATNAGTAWSKLLKDAGGIFHVVANDSTTSVVYLNSVTTNFQTTTWNAAGTIDTVTLPAAGSGAGGADIATSYDMIFSSYGLNIAPFNINMGVVNDIFTPSNNASAVYYTALPDTSGSIIVPLSAGNQERNVATAALPDGRPGVVYVDHSTGTLAAGRLKYALRDGTSADDVWTPYILPNTTNPLFPSLAYDHNDLPWISYYDSGNFRYYLVTNSATDGSGLWTQYQVPIGAKVASGTAPATDDTAITMFYSSGVAYPVMIFINSTAAGGQGVRSIKLNPITGQFSSIVTVDALGASFGSRLSADFDLSGNIIIAYYDLTTTTVKFNYSINGAVSWRPASTQITAATVGRDGLSIRFNPSNGRPAVSYYNKASNLVLYNPCSTALASCASAGSWAQVTAQSGTAVGVSGITTTTNEQILNTSLTFSAAGVPFISYMTGIAPSGMNPALVVTDSTTGFTPTLPTVLASSGTNASLSGTSAISFGQHGMSASSLRNSLGDLITLHVGPNNWLYSTSCGD